MPPSLEYDAVIVGSGPNGLAAAVRLAQAGARVIVYEAQDTIGGGTRTAELTLEGYLHDVCSAVHPLCLASPFLRELPLEDFGLEYVHPDIPLAHPLDGGTAVAAYRSLGKTAANLGPDTRAYTKIMAPLVKNWWKIMADFLGPLPLPPRHPLPAARFGLLALRSAAGLARTKFRGPRARALLAGMGAHSILPLDQPITAGVGLMLSLLAHAVGWPAARGGSQAIADALAAYLKTLQGKIKTGHWVTALDDLPSARAVVFDLTPRGILATAGDNLQPRYRKQLETYRYGPGVCKVDWALDNPIPWEADSACRAGTVHIGGTLEEIAAAEQAVWDGSHPQNPFVLLAQPSLFDPTRTPEGRHSAWAYCHVPHGSQRDMSSEIEAQIERFAPGFQDRVLARSVHSAVELEAYNPNYVGGDINGGAQTLTQVFTRPALKRNPYRIPTTGSGLPDLYLCSSSTPPGGGVHGMCGYHAARTVLRDWQQS